MTDKRGTLFGISVGPGDPDLISMKAVKTLGKVDVIFAASSTKNHHSQAVHIARLYIPKSMPVTMLSFPMTKDRSVAKAAWRENARIILKALEQGKNAAFLTLGDALTYSTYGYVLQEIQELAPDQPVETIPGITSYQAAAARLNKVLVEGEESLLVVSGVNGGDRLRQFKCTPENVVFMKAYKHVDDIAATLEECDMIDTSVGICQCGRPDEEIIDDVRELCKRPPGYWTLVIAKQPKQNEA
jgi:precorrin-2/cobalt-factor-2 C20-methyltransferase